MTARRNTWLVLAAAATIAALGAAPFAHRDALEERTVFVTVMGPNGPVLEGLSAGNFSVVEDNVTREVTGLAAATGVPVSAMLLIDTTRAASNTVQDLRKGVVAYATQLLESNPESEIGVIGFGGQATVLQQLTSDLEAITRMSARIVANTDGGSLMNEALVEASRILSEVAPERRRVMLTINHEPADEFSQTSFQDVAVAVQKSGATVYSISIVARQRRDPGREALLNALTSNSGGLYFGIGAPSGLVGVCNSLGFLAGVQYALSYERPDDAGPPKVVQVSVNVEGTRAHNNQWSGR
jgi:VWFA-related protein